MTVRTASAASLLLLLTTLNNPALAADTDGDGIQDIVDPSPANASQPVALQQQITFGSGGQRFGHAQNAILR